MLCVNTVPEHGLCHKRGRAPTEGVSQAGFTEEVPTDPRPGVGKAMLRHSVGWGYGRGGASHTRTTCAEPSLERATMSLCLPELHGAQGQPNGLAGERTLSLSRQRQWPC